MKEFFRLVGFAQTGCFWRDKSFYWALALGPLFYLVLSFWNKPHLIWKGFGLFLLRQFFWVAFPEEFFFRGFLIPFWKTYFSASWKGLSVANLLSAFVFALLHLFYHPWFWALGTFFPALIFGYFREKHNSLWPAVILHLVYNSGLFFF